MSSNVGGCESLGIVSKSVKEFTLRLIADTTKCTKQHEENVKKYFV